MDIFIYNTKNNYAFKEQDKTNLDSLYSLYKPLFKSLSLDDPQDIVKAHAYFEKITEKIFDGHFQIEFNTLGTNKRLIYPAYARKLKISNPPIDYFETSKLYLKKIYCDTIILDETIKPFRIRIGDLEDNKLYFAFNKLTFSNKGITDKSFNSIINIIKKSVIDKKYKYIIFDLRNNMGGLIEDLSYLSGFFTNKKILIGYNKYKIGFESENFSKDIASYIYPKNENFTGFNQEVKIIALIDNFTASAAELLAVTFKNLSNKTLLIGEKTFGATGIVSDKKLFGTGSYVINEMIKVHCTSVIFKDINNNLHENIGFSPDIWIKPEKGRDNILEYVKSDL